MVIIVCIKIIFSKVYSYIMVLLYLEKNSTATNKPGAENCQSTSQPILFCYIIWMRNGNIFDDCLNIIHITIKKLKKKNFMAPFYGWGSTASRLVPLRGGSLLFTTKFRDIPGTHFIDLGRTKG